MKLRYYMRGLGIGILVTAILMAVSMRGKTEKLSDEEIIARAEALGMVKEYDTTVLADSVKEPEEDEVPEKTTEPEESKERPEETESELQEIETDVDKEVPQEETVQTQEPAVSEEIIEIVVQGGDGSQTVARKLAEVGLVTDTLSYDKYLCANGYDKRICTGTHSIPKGATEEEIAEIITSKPSR